MIIFLQITGGLAFLFFGGEALVKGAVAFARHLGIAPLIIGLTVVAVGTSAPEIVVSVGAALKDHPDIAVGNIVGSNIANILLVMGVSALIYPIIISKRVIGYDLPVLLATTIFFIFFCFTENTITRTESAILIIGLIIYLWQLIKTSRSSSKDKKAQQELKDIEEELPQDMSNIKALLYIILGIIALIIGAEILVDGSVALARIFGLSEAVIGLTLIAIGSSAPELATCAVAAYHKHSDLVAGNIIGSNILNIMLGLNAAAIIKPLHIGDKFLATDIWIMLGATLLMALIILWKKNISKLSAGIFVTLYIAYIIYQFTSQ